MPTIPDDDLDTSAREPDTSDTRPPQSFSDMVRENPIGAVIGAFLVGLVVSRFL
jgi:hypothetical protein